MDEIEQPVIGILLSFGYRWENHTKEKLELAGHFDRTPGWCLYHDEPDGFSREIGYGDEAVRKAFAEINGLA